MTVKINPQNLPPDKARHTITIGRGGGRALIINGKFFLPKKGTEDEWISDDGSTIQGTKHTDGCSPQ
jgi:hypothetical protein